MITLIEGKTANNVWMNAVQRIRDKENVTFQQSRAGTTLEMLHTIFTIKDPRQRWVTMREPGINPAFAIVELIWILSGRRDSSFVLPWNRQLVQYIGDTNEYHGAYGYRLRANLGIDQIERAYLALKNNQDTRQVVMQIWDGHIDFPNSDGSPCNLDIPCNVVSLLKIRNGKLEWMQILRSNDLFRGVPYNFVQFTALQEIMAGWLGIEPGTYNHLSDSLHLYESDLESIQSTHNVVEEENVDSLCLPRDDSLAAIHELERRFDELGSPDLKEKHVERLANGANLPKSYSNLLFVVAGEAARRNRWIDLAESIMWNCTNPALIQAWFGWCSRFK